jgi:hypothetical protein
LDRQHRIYGAQACARQILNTVKNQGGPGWKSGDAYAEGHRGKDKHIFF